MAYDIGPRIGIDGEKEFRDAIRNVNQQVRTLTSEMSVMVSELTDSNDAEELLAEQSRILNQQISAQEEKIRLLNQGLDASADKYDEADTKTLQWKEAVNKATTELNKMRSQLAKVESDMDSFGEEADDASDALDDMGDSASGAGPGMDDFVKQLGNLKNMIVGGAIVTGVKEIAGMVLELEESTREYRQTMGTLEASSQTAGYSAEETAELYGRMHSVIGDTQAAAEASALLQALKLNTDDLNTASYTTIGMWTELGQSAPIESIAEATQQTISAGQATGALADWLAIAGIQEEEFNAKLEAANGATERAQIVLQTLADHGLVDAGQAWMDINQDIVKANESQQKMEEAMGRMGELVAPLANALRSFGADAIEWLADKIEDLLPMLEGMAEVAGKMWDAITGGNSGRVTVRGQTISNARGVDGSYATGLWQVPYDGFTPELHRDEMVIPASLAEMIRSSRSNDLTTLATGVVNGVQTAMTGAQGGSYTFNLVLPDGTTLAQYQLPALINVAQANGTPILNPVNG